MSQSPHVQLDDAAEAFRLDGFVVLRGLVGAAELALLRSASDAVIAEALNGEGSGHLFREEDDGRRVYWRSEAMWQRHPVFRAAAVNPALLAAVGSCIDDPFFPFNDALVVKQPGGGAPVPLHQDPPFGSFNDEPDPGPYPRPAFTADIYLDESTVDNGCLWVLPRRHQEGRVHLEARSEDEWFDDAIPVEMQPGDVLFHALSTPHGSRPNASDAQRRTYYVAFMTPRTRQDLYGTAAWAASKPVGDEATRRLIDEMIADRRGLGLSSLLDEPSLRLDGATFVWEHPGGERGDPG